MHSKGATKDERENNKIIDPCNWVGVVVFKGSFAGILWEGGGYIFDGYYIETMWMIKMIVKHLYQSIKTLKIKKLIPVDILRHL